MIQMKRAGAVAPSGEMLQHCDPDTRRRLAHDQRRGAKERHQEGVAAISAAQLVHIANSPLFDFTLLDLFRDRHIRALVLALVVAAYARLEAVLQVNRLGVLVLVVIGDGAVEV